MSCLWTCKIIFIFSRYKASRSSQITFVRHDRFLSIHCKKEISDLQWKGKLHVLAFTSKCSMHINFKINCLVFFKGCNNVIVIIFWFYLSLNIGTDKHGDWVRPWNRFVLIPPSSHHDGHIETQHEGNRYQIPIFLAISYNLLENSRKTKTNNNIIKSVHINLLLQ